VSRTATTVPAAPGRPATIRFRQAPIASMPPGETGSSWVPGPSQGRRFHCNETQPPGAPLPSIWPESLGTPEGASRGERAEAVAM
jgi:hypothetical protein